VDLARVSDHKGDNPKHQWVVFANVGKQLVLLQPFKDHNVATAFRTNTALEKQLCSPPKKLKNGPCNGCGVHRLKCENFPGPYVGQAGRTFRFI
jgi:hypothetical protein